MVSLDTPCCGVKHPGTGMRTTNNLLNGITRARVTSERTEAFRGPRLEAG
jgi:hypothetical protein